MTLEFTAPSPAGTRASVVTDELRRMIRAGELPAGSRLRQTDIAQRFGVSTTPVREAFTSLAREGLVKQDAHRGVVVFVPSRDDLTQNYEIRLALEPMAAGFAATQATAEDVAVLEGLLEEMRVAVHQDTPRHAAELNPAFHRRIYAAAQRPRLAELIEQLRDAAASYTQVLSLTPQPDGYLDGAQHDHERILEAIKAGDSEAAEVAMTDHLSVNRDQIMASLRVDDAAAAD